MYNIIFILYVWNIIKKKKIDYVHFYKQCSNSVKWNLDLISILVINDEYNYMKSRFLYM